MATAPLPPLLEPNAAAAMTPMLPIIPVQPPQMQATAAAAQAEALSYTGALQSLISSLKAPLINPQFPTINTAPVPITVPLPTLQQVNWLTPTDPGALSATLDISGISMPPFTAIPPVITLPTAPTDTTGAAPDSPKVDLNFQLPTLNFQLPVAPSLLSINDVTFDGVTLPTFDATRPVLNAVAPNITVFSEGPKYTSALLTSLYADLQNAIANGANLTPGAAYEGALWDRAREREYRQKADALSELDRMEATGFALPPGIWLDARLKIETELANNIAGASREIMAKQAELMLENLVKARENAMALESKQLEITNEFNQRALEAAKYQTEAAVSIYNASVVAFQAQNEAYKAAAMVYDYQIKGALALVEVFKTEVEAERAKSEINHNLIEAYLGQIKGQELNVEIYKAELGALETQANLQKLKVETFGEQIRAYTAQIGAFSARVEAYKVGVEAEVSKETVFKTQVDAYKSQVDAGIAQINSRVETYKAQIAAYDARLEAYKAALTAMTEQAKSAALYNTSQADVYKAEITGLSAYNQTLTEQWKAVAEISEKEAEVGVKAAEAQGQLYVATKGLAIEAAKTGALVSGQLGAAALNAIHFSASTNWSSSLSQGITQSINAGWSEVESHNENDNKTA